MPGAPDIASQNVDPARRPDDPAPPAGRQALLCVSPSFSPDTTPTAIRASKLLSRLAARWEVTVLTEAEGTPASAGLRVEVVRRSGLSRLLPRLRRLRLDKLLEMVLWPDESILWVLPAILAGRRLIRETSPSAIVVFMMPYSAGLVGIVLSRLSGLPLVLNLDDSPTCTDMHPTFPSRLHYRLAKGLEDRYARRADAVVYVSETNLEAVRARQPEPIGRKFHLVRYGADPADFRPSEPSGESFEIVYVGAMSGWWTLIAPHASAGPLARLYGAWTRLGRYERMTLDQRSSSPAILGGALLDTLAEHPDWEGRVQLRIYGNPYPAPVVARALAGAGVESVVTVLAPVPHDRVADILARADLLFLTLPGRVDGSRGGRISAKTYEYLMTDRPILAAVPKGENWDYLEGKPGVWLVDPSDRGRIREVVEELAAAKFAGAARTFDRDGLREQLSYETRAQEFAAVIDTALQAPEASR